jgi:hypothetical protein
VCLSLSHTHAVTTSPARPPLNSPIKRLRTDRLQLVPLFPPGPPTGILEPDPIGDLVLVTSHRPPTRPDVLFRPIVGEVVYADAGEMVLDVFCRGGDGAVDREGGEGGDDLSHGGQGRGVLVNDERSGSTVKGPIRKMILYYRPATGSIADLLSAVNLRSTACKLRNQ